MRNILSYLSLILLLVMFSYSAHALVVVRMETVLPGDIDVELYDDVAPLAVANFLGYVQRGDFTVFGRVQGDGMAVVDAIAALRRVNAGRPSDSLPVLDYDSSGVLQPENYVYVNRVVTV